ncbi:ATP-binding protein [Actinoplanes sp. NPDC023714]|uniref:ATP-binding protein n=1 Tax=Actinoplanes sp. NPDC023714 TaxID=3154322 RepID=UPI0033DD894A
MLTSGHLRTGEPRRLAAQVRRSGELAAASTELRVRAAAAVAGATALVSMSTAHRDRLRRLRGVVAEVRPAPAARPPRLVSRVFTLAGIGAVRQLIRTAAAGAGLSRRAVPDFVLAVQELMTNAVRHGGGWGCVRLHRDGPVLVCVVSDRGPGMTGDLTRMGRLPDTTTAAGGRGLFLAGQMTDSLHLKSSPRGVIVTVTMNLPDGGPPRPPAVGAAAPAIASGTS